MSFAKRADDESQNLYLQLANLTRRFRPEPYSLGLAAVDAVLQGPSRLQRPAEMSATLPREWTTDEGHGEIPWRPSYRIFPPRGR